MMRWALLATLVVGSLASAEQSAPEKMRIKTGFLTGTMFLDMNATEQSHYAVGLVDGILLAPLYGARKDGLLRVEQ